MLDVQTVIDVAEMSGGVAHLPAGEYHTYDELFINSPRASLLGDGPQHTVIIPHLAPGQHALTLGWSGAASTQGPYNAVSGITFRSPTGEDQPSALRITGQGGQPHANSLTFRDVGIQGFQEQVLIEDQAYLTLFERVFFHSAAGFGVRQADGVNSGESLTFADCTWSGGPGTAVYLDKSGANANFRNCNFDYMARAVWQRAGMSTFTGCHFETGTEYGPGGEVFLLDRRGSVNPPMMTLTDCHFFDKWVDYDACFRFAGPGGDFGLRLVNPYIERLANSIPYFIRDDGGYRSNIRIDGSWFGRPDFQNGNSGGTPAKIRRQSGLNDLALIPTVTQMVT